MPFKYRIRVRYAETDQMGVVYHAHYLVWCEAARTELMRLAGYPYTTLEKQGFMLAVADATLRYHAPARYDDEVDVETWVTSVRSRTAGFGYLLSDVETGRKLVTAAITLVCLGAGGQALVMPADVQAVLRRHLA